MTAAEKAIDALVVLARNEIGYLEKASNSNLDSKTGNAGFGNWTKYARDIDEEFSTFYNGKKNGYAYCDVFVDWCFIKTFGVDNALKLLCAPKYSAGAGCIYSAQYYRNAHRWYTYPKRGDQIFFGSPGNETHTGIVSGVDDTYVYTIEGNTSRSRGVVPNGGGVWDKKYRVHNPSISGYGRPDYSIVENAFTGGGETPKPVPDSGEFTEQELDDYEYSGPLDIKAEKLTYHEATNTACTLHLAELSLGCKGENVKAMQRLLIGQNFDCGVKRDNGYFGYDTRNAVENFQMSCGLEMDGICGTKTWNRLLKG